MTLQEILNTVVAHLRKQGRKSTTSGDFCAYRGKNGTKCAVGCLIKDEFYVESFEAKNVRTWAVSDALVKSGVLAQDEFYDQETWSLPLRLLSRLQSIHDGTRVKDWDAVIEEAIEPFNLTMPAKETI